MICEEHRAKSAELNVTSSQAIRRAWTSSRGGKFKAQRTSDSQLEPQQTLCSKFWRTKLPAANQADKTKVNMDISPKKECTKNPAKASRLKLS